jgi:DNA-binding PucR family transcriptional regulator
VLLRDQPAIADLVQSVLGQLVHARGGAEPLLATLDAYFASGSVTTETARRLHLSVRAVTYRLDRIKTLTGYDPTDPAQRFTVHAAVLGARLLGWPERDFMVDR